MRGQTLYHNCDCFANWNNISCRSCGTGQIALPFILLVSGIIVEITIAGSFVAYFLSSSGLGERLLVRAEAAAQSGIRDAMVRIAQNKEYASGGASYSLTVGSDTATITVSRVTSDPTVYVYTVTSLGVAGSRQKKFVATAYVHKITGAMQTQSVVDTAIE